MNSEIIHDILNQMNSNYTSKSELEYNGDIRNILEQKISKQTVKYNDDELAILINDLLEIMNMNYFTKTDVIKAHKKINDKNEKCTTDVSLNISNTNVKQVFSSIFNTITNLINDFILLILSVCIIANLQTRSEYATGLSYPKNESKFPYVFFDKTSKLKQSHLVSTAPSDDYMLGAKVFVNVE